MRFYDIAIFIICLNIAITIVSSTSIFPNLQPPQLIDVQAMATTSGTYGSLNSSAAAADTTGFFAFIFLPLQAMSMFVNLLYSVTFGVSTLVYWMFNCMTACPAYVQGFAIGINSVVLILYAVSIIQLLSGRFVESN